jgi:hypothetical protein
LRQIFASSSHSLAPRLPRANLLANRLRGRQNPVSRAAERVRSRPASFATLFAAGHLRFRLFPLPFHADKMATRKEG